MNALIGSLYTGRPRESASLARSRLYMGAAAYRRNRSRTGESSDMTIKPSYAARNTKCSSCRARRAIKRGSRHGARGVRALFWVSAPLLLGLRRIPFIPSPFGAVPSSGRATVWPLVGQGYACLLLIFEYVSCAMPTWVISFYCPGGYSPIIWTLLWYFYPFRFVIVAKNIRLGIHVLFDVNAMMGKLYSHSNTWP